MHRFGFLPSAVLVAFFVMLAGVFAEDSADLFLKAYEHFQTAEKLEREGKPREALGKYEDARQVLEEIRKASPDWQPLIVEYRLKKVQEGIARLQPEVANLPPPVDSIEGPMPEPDRESRSTSFSGPQVVVPRSTPSRTSRELDQPRSRSVSATERELRRLREQLEEARRENRRLERNLEKKTAELQMALTELDKTKVSLVEVKAEYAQAAAALEDARKDSSVGATLRAEFDKRAAEVISKLAQTEADNEVLKEENERLLAKLEEASKYISASDGIRDGLLKDRDKLVKERDAAVQKAKKIKDNSAEIERLAGENKELKGKLKEAETLAATKGSDAEKLLREVKVLTNKLAEAYMHMPRPGVLEKLIAQRDALQKKVAELEKQKSASDPAKERQIATLQTELEEARKKLAELEKNQADPAKDRQIASLQSDLNTANDRLLEAQGQVSQRDEKLRQLQKQLDQATGELAQLKLNPTPSREEKNLIAENELLRNIILRQIKEQSRREEAVKAVEAVVAAAPAQLAAAKPHLAVLSEPALKLTDEERALFNDPVSLLTQPAGAESLDVTMVVAKPGDGQKKSEKPARRSVLPEELRGKFEEAKKLFEAEDFAGAEKIFQNLAEAAPDNYYILSNLGAVQIESGKLSAAEVALKKAIQINGADSYAHRNLGIVYSRQGKIEAAIEALRRSVTADDRDSIAHNYLGVCLGQKEQREEAEKEFKRAIAIDPNYQAAHFNLAVLYATSQPPNIEPARKPYRKAIELGAPPDASLERLIQ